VSTTFVLLQDGSEVPVSPDDHGMWVLPHSQRVSPTAFLMKSSGFFVCYAPGEDYDGKKIGTVKETN